MRLLFAFLAAALSVACTGNAEDQLPPAEPLLPGGYKVVVDANSTGPGHFTVTDTADIVRLTTGPAGVAWRPQDVVGPGDVRVEATLRVYNAPVGYREGFGIFVGGRDLESAAQTYVYLLVRPSGDFTIRRRRGNATEAIVEWTAHDAVQRVNQDDEAPWNTLAIQVLGADADFLVNGARVFSMEVGELRPQGIAGLRINHRLDVGLTAWSLGPPPAPPVDATSGT